MAAILLVEESVATEFFFNQDRTLDNDQLQNNSSEVDGFRKLMVLRATEGNHLSAGERRWIQNQTDPESLLIQGVVHRQNGDFDESNRVFNQLLDECSKTDFVHIYAVYLLGNNALATLDIHSDTLNRLFERFNSLAKKSKNLTLLALRDYRLGLRKFLDGEVNSARAHWIRALRKLKQDGHKVSYELGILYVNIGILYRDLYGFHKSIRYFEKGIEIGHRRNNHWILKKCFREMGFLYYYQGNYQEAYISTQLYSHYLGNDTEKIEFELLRTYLFLARRQWKQARKNLLQAYWLSKKLNISRTRFDFSYHLSMLYCLSRDFGKADVFFRYCEDPINKLNLMKERLEKSRTVELCQVNKYLVLSQSTESFYHIERARRLSRIFLPGQKVSKKAVVKINLQQNFIWQEGRTVVDIKKKKLILRCIELFLKENRPLSKKEILKNVFDFNFYDAEIHDSKVYKLISSCNKLLKGTSLFISESGFYEVNPQIYVLWLDRYQVSTGVVYDFATHKSKISDLSQLAKTVGIPLSRIKK